MQEDPSWLCGRAMASEERRASTEHPVVSEPKEWAGAEDSDDDKPIEKHASRSFEAREKRLTVAAVNLQSDKILGDQEVAVVDQQKEWKDGEESEEEASPDRVAKRASQSFQKRESRLAQGAVIRRSFARARPAMSSPSSKVEACGRRHQPLVTGVVIDVPTCAWCPEVPCAEGPRG